MKLKNMDDPVLDFISTLSGSQWKSRRKIHPKSYIETIYSQGNCGNFALILKKIFSEGIIVLDTTNSINHLVFQYNSNFYDINGKYKNCLTKDMKLKKGCFYVSPEWVIRYQYGINGFSHNFTEIFYSDRKTPSVELDDEKINE